MSITPLETGADSLAYWMERYQELAVKDIRAQAVARKIGLHLGRFLAYFNETYGHDRISACIRRDVLAWQSALQTRGYAHATVNNHLASLSGFTTWVQTHNPRLFPNGDPAKGIGELPDHFAPSTAVKPIPSHH